jgi:phage terminase large subunit GpA-like protein
LDYVELMGDPADDAVWVALTDLLNRPIDHENGHKLPILSTAIDAGGHRTEAVKDFVRRRVIRRPMVIFGAVPNNAPVLSRPKAQDVNWRGRIDKRGVNIHHVGTVAIKNVLFGRLATDGDKDNANRLVHFSEELPNEFFSGVVSETYDPRANRFVKRRGARNEPLDTWVYAYAAAHHPELRLHLYSQAKWAELAQSLNQSATPIDKIEPEPVQSKKSTTNNHTQSMIAARQSARRKI